MRFLFRKILSLLYGPEETLYAVQVLQFGTWKDLAGGAVYRTEIQARQRVEDLQEQFPNETWRVERRKGWL